MSFKNVEIETRLATDDGKPLIKYVCVVNGKYIINHEDLEAYLESDQRISKWAYIIHDKDINEEGLPVAPHIHIMVSFGKSPRQVKTIAGMFDINESCVQKIHSKWPHAIAYLTHHNAPDKYQYDINEVHASYDISIDIDKSDKIKDERVSKQEAEEIALKIANGEIREYQIPTCVPQMIQLKYDRILLNARKMRTEFLETHAQERDMECIYIQGTSGSGKTALAKRIAEKKGYSYYVSSGSNDPLDGYKGQDCLILDDIRGSVMKLSDLLKMLDPHTGSSVKSRYKNKVLECKLIIITSVQTIDNFFAKVFEHEDEPIKQLKRRCRILITMDENLVTLSGYDDEKGDYCHPVTEPNPIRKLYKPIHASKEDNIASLFALGIIDDSGKGSVTERTAAYAPDEVLSEKLTELKAEGSLKIKAFKDGDQLVVVTENTPKEFEDFIRGLTGNEIGKTELLSQPRPLGESGYV